MAKNRELDAAERALRRDLHELRRLEEVLRAVEAGTMSEEAAMLWIESLD